MIHLIFRFTFMILLVSVVSCVQDPGVTSKCPFYDPRFYAVPDTFLAYFPSDSLGERDSTFFGTEDGILKDTIVYQDAFDFGIYGFKNQLISKSNRDQTYESFKCSEEYKRNQTFLNSRDNWSFSFRVQYPKYRSGSPYDNLKDILFSISRFAQKENRRINGGWIIFHFQYGKSRIEQVERIRFLSNLRLNNGKSYAKALSVVEPATNDTIYFAQNVGLVAYTVDGKMYYRK